MFGTRKLRREIVVLMDENERLRKEIREAKYESDKHVKYCNQLADELQSATIKLETATKKLDGVEIKLRKQNEADLMLESVKIIASLLKGKKEKDVTKSVESQKQFLAQWHGWCDRFSNCTPTYQQTSRSEYETTLDKLGPFRNTGMAYK